MSKRLPVYVTIGIIEKAHGIKGEVKVKPLTDYPPRFKYLSTVTAELPNKEVLELQVRKASVHGDAVYVSFDDIDSREQALALQGAFLNIKRQDVLPIGEGEFYHFEMIGLQVKTATGEYLGSVEDVIELTSNAVLTVRSEEREYLIPMIKDVIRKIDMDSEEIIINPLEGLLELNNAGAKKKKVNA